VQVEGVNDVREAVFQHFQHHFVSSFEPRPCISNSPFKYLSSLEGVELIKPFTMEEIIHTVWDCDSFNSLGADGVDVGFVKEFWDILKEDLCRFFNGFNLKSQVN